MHVLLNELSYENGDARVEKEVFDLVTTSLIEAVKFFKGISKAQVIYWTGDSNIYDANHKFFDNKSYKEYLGSLSREERGTLLALFGKLNCLKIDVNEPVLEENTQLASFSVVPYSRLEGEKYGCVSLFTKSDWEAHELK